MAFTVNIYQENVLKVLGVYGTWHQQRSTAWNVEQNTMFAILCSTDVAAFSSSFVGTLEQLLATGVTEASTGNGYIQGGKQMPNFTLTSFQGTVYTNSFASGYGNGVKYTPAVTPVGSSSQYRPVRWFPSAGQTLSAKSMILCIRSPVSTATPFYGGYGSAYPMVMIDFGGTKSVTGPSSTGFDINWNANGAINWTR